MLVDGVVVAGTVDLYGDGNNWHGNWHDHDHNHFVHDHDHFHNRFVGIGTLVCLPTMDTVTAMVDVRGCAAKLSLPEALIGGTATTAA